MEKDKITIVESLRDRVGILTFHSAFNEGSILQSFCLNQLLQQKLNRSVEIIDHNYQSRIDFYGSPNQNERTKALHEFINQLPLSHKAFVDNDSTTFDYIDNHYSALFIGSDEIWKVNYPSKRLYPPFPNVYWPNQRLRIPKISYAACIGDTNWEKLPDSFLNHMKESIESFNLLSVRDNRTLEFLKWLKIENSNEVSIIPDPVLSFDLIPYIDLRFLKDKLIKLGIDFTKARMGIYSSQCNVMDRIINHLRRRDIQIVAISDYLGEVDISLVENGFTPIEWAFIPRFMTYCISNRMHGCITNLINNTPFIALDLRDKP